MAASVVDDWILSTAADQVLGALESAWPAHCCEAELLHIPNVTSPHASARQVEAALFLEARLVSQAARAAELDILRRAA